MNSRKISFIISILGILILLFIANNMKAKEVNSYHELKIGDYVKTEGRIAYIRNYDDFSVIKLENNITVTCNCNFKKNQTIIVEGKVEEYNGLQVNAERITSQTA